MAALTGVKVIDMVGGEVSKISYNGDEYSKVAISEAEAGGIVMSAERADDVRAGDYFEIENVSSDIEFRDRADDLRYWSDERDMSVFNKSSATNAKIAEIESRLSTAEERIAALEAAQPSAQQAQSLKVGDKVRLLSGAERNQLHGFIDRQIYEVRDNGSQQRGEFKIKIYGGGSGNVHGYAKPDQLEKVTDEEAQQLEAAAKFAEIGRKPGEFKAGDIVYGERGLKSGSFIYGEIADIDTSGKTGGVKSFEDGEYRSIRFDKLITPVERRFDRG